MTANDFNINWLEFDTEVITSTEQVLDDQLTIFPNPVIDGQVQIKANQKGLLDLMIYSIDGKIKSQQQINLAGTESVVLDLALTPGIYYVEVILPTGRKSQRKLIVK